MRRGVEVFAFLNDWSEILPREGGHVISLYGAGGKTSLLEAMARKLATENVPVVVTTTTRTEPLDWPELDVRGWREFTASPASSPKGLLGLVRDDKDRRPEDKWPGITPDQVDALGGLLPEHVVLVEADGGACKPVKIHREGEPVMPARTSLAVPVFGLGAIGGKPEDVLHRHGRLEAPWLELAEDGVWDWEAMYRLLAAPDGYLGRIRSEVPVLPAFLQMDLCDDSIGFFGFVGRVMEELGLQAVLLGDTSGPEPRLKTAIAAPSDLEPASD